MKLYNTLSKKVEEFDSISQDDPKQVNMYACGPTVYDYSHIGHLRKYVMDDVLVRVLRHLNYDVRHVQNITDVGHLVSDDDEGEDKMEKGARKYGQSAREIARKFEDYFFYSMDKMGILRPTLSCRATEHIQSQLEMVLDLEKKGFTYIIEGDGVYFDTSKLEKYGELSGHDPRNAPHESRMGEVAGKKNPTDFALWKFEKPGENRQMIWPSPWSARSFPGWHVECSAMSIEHLGPQIDIHTGGIDHIAVHHANEIAQSETFTGKKPFARFWVHHNFLRVDGEKMSKSLGNFYTIDDIIKRGFSPAALRLLFLSSHYRSEQNFTFQSLEASQTAFEKLLQAYLTIKKNHRDDADDQEDNRETEKFSKQFFAFVEDDLNTPEAVTVLWQVLKSDLSDRQKYFLLLEFDRVLGLGLISMSEKDLSSNNQEILSLEDLPDSLQKLFAEREAARSDKDFAKADQIRQEFAKVGYQLIDQAGSVLIKR
ncbi:cysteine--tRNA ligase [Patescibacteria group bacterium]|nr:cysteine--tRNA ligase [Patescibacteria group bacterium]